MSFPRYVYYCALAGGWGAFTAWALAQACVLGLPALETVITSALVGGLVGLGLNLVAAAAAGAWLRRLGRGAASLAAGALAGAVGGFVGELLYQRYHVPRAVGWMVIGLGIGSAEGLFDRSWRKLRNGLLGGGLGGLCGGLLFEWIALPGSGRSSGAVASGLVVLGTAVGALFGLAQVVLKEAWLTVLDGFRPGRQLILSRELTVLGRADHLPLPLLGPAARDLEGEHAVIRRGRDGSYTVQDNSTRCGTLLNQQRLQGPAPLADGDVLRLGGNLIRFNHRQRLPGDGRKLPAAVPSAVGSLAQPSLSMLPQPQPVVRGVPPPPSVKSMPPLPPASPQSGPLRPAPPQPPAPRIPTPPPPPPRRNAT